jgi:hypothetical protein
MSRSFTSSRGNSRFPWCIVGAKVSDKNLDQQIDIKFCVNRDSSANEMLARLTLAYGEHAFSQLVVLNGIRGSRKGEMCKMIQGVESQKRRAIRMTIRYESIA